MDQPVVAPAEQEQVGERRGATVGPVGDVVGASHQVCGRSHPGNLWPVRQGHAVYVRLINGNRAIDDERERYIAHRRGRR